MNTLVIVSHPHIANSVINKRWILELQKKPERYTVHELAVVYPDGNIDVKREQELVEAHSNLVFQFPIYWFSAPPILKKWLDEVLEPDWAYGKNGDGKLLNRKVALAVTAGIREEDYHKNGQYHYTMEQILTPFEATLRYYCHANYRSFFAFYGAEIIPGENYASTSEEVEKSANDYMVFLENM